MNDETLKQILNNRLIGLAFSKQLKIHLVLKDNSWRNGFVTKVFGDTFDFKDSQNSEESFFYVEVKAVEPFRSKTQ